MTKTYYKIDGFLKNSEQNVYSEGCLPNSGGCHWVEYTIEPPTIEDLIEKAMDFIGIDDKKNVSLNACEEQGRIDFQVYEDDGGYAASEHDFNLWREGKRELWLCDYIAHVSLIEEKDGLDLVALVTGPEKYTNC